MKIKRRLSRLEIKFFCIILLASLLVSIAIIYWQYKLVIKNIESEIINQISLTQNDISNSLDSYDSIFKIVANKLNQRKDQISQTYIIELLKQFYISEKMQENSKIDYLDINWQGRTGSPINRYGELPKIDLPPNVENHIKTFPKEAYLYSIPSDSKNSSSRTMFLTMGIINENQQYIGNLTFMLDFKSWINGLAKRLDNHSLIAFLIDQKQEILLSTDRMLSNYPTTLLNYDQIGHGNKLTNKISINGYCLSHYFLIEPHNYTLLFGYDLKQAYKQTFIKVLPLFTIFWSAILILTTLSYFYSRQLREKIKKDFHEKINELVMFNNSLREEKEKLLSNLSQQTYITQKHGSLLQAAKISEHEKEKFINYINDRIFLSLIELKESIKVLLSNIEGKLSIPINQKQQQNLLTNMLKKFEDLSAGCLTKNNPISINIKTIINDTLNLFSQEILENNLLIKINLTKASKEIMFDELLLRQLLANLLRECITSSKSKGELRIYAYIKHNSLTFKVKDNGYGIMDQSKVNNTRSINRFSSPLKLELTAIRNAVESCGGSINIEYKVGLGKEITLHLPLQDNNPTTIIENNVVPFKKY